jgi:hypothetical protein
VDNYVRNEKKELEDKITLKCQQIQEEEQAAKFRIEELSRKIQEKKDT